MKNKLLILLSIIEGICFISYELIATKIAAPFYGTDVDVWAIYFALILAGLGIGYISGGVWSKNERKSILLYIYATLIILYLFNFLFVSYIFEWSLMFSSKLGLLLSATFQTLIICVLYGMISPIIISKLNFKNSNAGFTSGILFFTSTISGGIGVLLYGLYIIPIKGLFFSQLSTIILLIISLIILFIINKNEKQISPTDN